MTLILKILVFCFLIDAPVKQCPHLCAQDSQIGPTGERRLLGNESKDICDTLAYPIEISDRAAGTNNLLLIIE
jgi:hypothetical protein